LGCGDGHCGTDETVCTGVGDCSNGGTCDASTGVCVPPCKADSDCTNGFVCQLYVHTCLATTTLPCMQDSDCTAPGAGCDVAAGVCLEGGARCLSDTECADSQVCYNGACVPSVCFGDADCDLGQTCHTRTRTCVRGSGTDGG
jgi:Cys-rich repeat protein